MAVNNKGSVRSSACKRSACTHTQLSSGLWRMRTGPLLCFTTADLKCQDGTEPRGEHSSLLTLQPETLDGDITMDVYWNATMVSQQQSNLCESVCVSECVLKRQVSFPPLQE